MKNVEGDMMSITDDQGAKWEGRERPRGGDEGREEIQLWRQTLKNAPETDEGSRQPRRTDSDKLRRDFARIILEREEEDRGCGEALVTSAVLLLKGGNGGFGAWQDGPRGGGSQAPHLQQTARGG
ncbi:hypothetical protein GHT09_005782 [Marmota monax]|uniref:Uncharacterized protein n=1 Tax=Marmota monax TaxID=9995 RepID=A0A834UML5_MARMO|nr:hypothetical protein GHT09_005782 [Marmota monax]